jgi:hypothetical protein
VGLCLGKKEPADAAEVQSPPRRICTGQD